MGDDVKHGIHALAYLPKFGPSLLEKVLSISPMHQHTCPVTITSFGASGKHCNYAPMYLLLLAPRLSQKMLNTVSLLQCTCPVTPRVSQDNVQNRIHTARHLPPYMSRSSELTLFIAFKDLCSQRVSHQDCHAHCSPLDVRFVRLERVQVHTYCIVFLTKMEWKSIASAFVRENVSYLQ